MSGWRGSGRVELEDANLTVRFSAMGNTVDNDAASMIVYGIEDSIVTHAKTTRVGVPFELFGVEGSRVFCETFNRVRHQWQEIARQTFQLFGGRGGIENLIHQRLTSAQRVLSPSGSTSR